MVCTAVSLCPSSFWVCVLAIEDDETHVDVFGQEFVGNAVFVNDIVVQSSAADGSSREESKDTGKLQCQSLVTRRRFGSASRMGRGRSQEVEEEEKPEDAQRDRIGKRSVSYPPRKAPTGLRTGMAPTGTSSKRAELWKLRRAMAGVERPAARRRTGIESAREAIVCVFVRCVRAA